MALEIEEQVDLAPFNTFGVSQRAAFFARITSVDDLREAREFAGLRRLPLLVLGEGSNTLFIKDFPGLVLFIANQGKTLLPEAGRLRAAAGENWHELVKYSLKNSLYGIENLALIPGTVGAAPIQNIGAYGVELERFFFELEAFDLATGETRRMNKADCEFGYRDSIFKHDAGRRLVVLSVTLQLSEFPAVETGYAGLTAELEEREATPQNVFDAVCAIRSRKLPDPSQIGNAGSFFKNPLISRAKLESLKQQYGELPAWDTPDSELVKIPAAWLLDQKGWKGRQRGGAAVHQDHALVLINHDNATGEDLLLLAQDMSSSVLEAFGIALQTEVRLV